MQQNSTENSPLVSISLVTYNHGKYIEEALNSFIKQKTNFPFEILVHDDASTDNTSSIIRSFEAKYPTIFHVIYQTENQYSKGNKAIQTIYNLPRARGKYIALCEGDDYWIDEFKLQKQIDFLENNSEYALIHSKVKYVDTNNNTITPFKHHQVMYNWAYSGDVFYDLFNKGNNIITASVIMRIALIDTDVKMWFIFDYWRYLDIARKAKVAFLDEETSAYRIHANGLTQKKPLLILNYTLTSQIDILYRFIFKSNNLKRNKKALFILKALISIIKNVLRLIVYTLQKVFNNT